MTILRSFVFNNNGSTPDRVLVRRRSNFVSRNVITITCVDLLGYQKFYVISFSDVIKQSFRIKSYRGS